MGRYGRSGHLLWPYAALVILFLLVLPDQSLQEFDYDEGLNVARASLLRVGHSLYAPIWSDQPPLFPALLSQWWNLVGNSLTAWRFLPAVFGTIILLCVFHVVRQSHGSGIAFLSVGFVLLAQGFLRFSQALMIGIPALSLAFLSLTLGGRRLIIPSAVVFALALSTKLTSAVVLPALFLACQRRDLIRWSISAMLSWAVVSWLFFPEFLAESWSQLIQPHLAAASVYAQGGGRKLLLLLVRDLPFIALAGCGASVATDRRPFVVPAVWCISSLLFLWCVRPMWPHHYPLFSVPLAWLAAMAAAEIFRALRQRWKVYVAGTLLLVVVGVRMNGITRMLTTRGWKLNSEVIELLKREQPGEILTDRPIYAALGGHTLPPQFAVLSEKRTHGDRDVRQELKQWVRTNEVPLILVARYPWLPQVLRRDLRERYEEIYRGRDGAGAVRLFRRSDSTNHLPHGGTE